MLSPVALATLKAGTTPVILPHPEGEFTAHLRPVSVNECLTKLGYIPDAFGATVAASKDPIRNKQAEYFVEQNPDWATKLTNLMLTCSVAALTAPGDDGPVTEYVQLVDKRQIDCAPGEMALESISDEWATAIVTAAMNINGLTQEAAESAATFPRKRKLTLGIGFHWASLFTRPGKASPGTAH